MSKKIDPIATTKLSKIPQSRTDMGIITSKKTTLYPKAFRFTSDDIENLKKITKDINNESRRKISEAKVLQALIHIGSQTSMSTIMKALREIL